jgi:PTH1 family peptidyl-tRNA hydrolase
MKLIAGLGNPGRRYARTRHNLGYQTVDQLAGRWGIDVGRERFSGLMGLGRCGEQDVLLLKPTTFMNLSGESVLAAWQFYKLSLAELMVIVDDLALPVGRVRVRAGGSAGGHKGLADIIRRLGSHEFARVRIGIGPAARGETVGYVLSPAEKDEAPLLSQAIATATEAVECWVREGIEESMNRFNGPPPSSRRKALPSGLAGQTPEESEET